MSAKELGTAELLYEIARRTCPDNKCKERLDKDHHTQFAYEIACQIRAMHDRGLRVDPNEDIYTIEGINYTGELMRGLGGAFPLGMLIEIVDRDGKGSVHFRVLYNPKGETK